VNEGDPFIVIIIVAVCVGNAAARSSAGNTHTSGFEGGGVYSNLGYARHL